MKNHLKISAIVSMFLFLIISFVSISEINAYSDDNDRIVYITATGDCYHNDGCGSLSRSKIPITLGEAKRRGYTACSKCFRAGNDVPSPSPSYNPVPTQEPEPIPEPTPNPTQPPSEECAFGDVNYNDFFYTPVLWAVEKGITSGITATEFRPSSPCTREQSVTFLWRAAGCPEPQNSYMPFSDVKPGAYYEKPILWAVENGITSGISATKFGVGYTCTREQIVTFLWRANGKPGYSGNNPFSDVKEDMYAYDSILWAVEKKVTSGISATLFGPKMDCTRGQIVTFLYRDKN